MVTIRVAVVSDTHGLLRPEVVPALAGCDRVLHLGDVGGPEVLEGLAEIGPVTAVRGNTDRGPFGASLPLTEFERIAGHDLYLIHIVDDLDLDPEAAGISVVMYGHSHRPSIEQRGSVLWLNPGSCGPRRFDLPVTVAILTLVEGREPVAQIVDLELRPGASPGAGPTTPRPLRPA